MVRSYKRGFSNVALFIVIGLIAAWGVFHILSSNKNATGGDHSLYSLEKGTVTDLGSGYSRYTSAAYNFSVDFPNSLVVGVQVTRISSSGSEIPGFTEVNPINNGGALSETEYPLHITVQDYASSSPYKLNVSNVTVSTSGVPGTQDVRAILAPPSNAYSLVLWFRVNPQDTNHYQDLLKQIIATVKFN